MKITLIEKKMLTELFRASNGLLIYSLFSRYRLSPSEMFKFVDKFSKEEVLIKDDDRITLSDYGRRLLLSKKLFSLNSGSSADSKLRFSRIPEKFTAPRLGINEFYIPKISPLMKEILSLPQNNGEGEKG